MVIRKYAPSSHPPYLLLISLTHPSPGSSLSGNHTHPVAGSSTKDDGNHVVVFAASRFDLPEINLTHGGLILIALLSGGDYHQAGLPGCGPKVAHGLAKCGFGHSLLSAARTLSREDLQAYLTDWKSMLAEELRTNSRGILGRRYKILSNTIPEDFPDIDVLISYTNPITSETEGKTHKIKATWERPLDLGRIAYICELYFEWGVRHAIIKRFRTVIWPAAVFRFLRESVLEKDLQKGGRPPPFATTHLPPIEPPSSSPSTSATTSLSHLQIGGSPICQDLIRRICSTRSHHSTDGLLEYRLKVSPERLVALTSAGIKDIRPPLIADISSDGTTDKSDRRMKKPPSDPSSNLRVWIPACVVRAAVPSLVDSFEEHAKRTPTKTTTHTKPASHPNGRSDCFTSGRRSKILALVDNIATTKPSQRNVSKVSPGKRPRPPPQTRVHRIRPEASPAPTPLLSQESILAPEDPIPGGVTEISSDFDEGDSAPPRQKPRVAPLLVVRSRRRAQPQIPNDIIDLT
jgi:hypothetical protein